MSSALRLVGLLFVGWAAQAEPAALSDGQLSEYDQHAIHSFVLATYNLEVSEVVRRRLVDTDAWLEVDARAMAFIGDESRSGSYTERLATDCERSTGLWKCGKPYRMLVLESECPVARIKVDPAVSTERALELFEDTKSEFGEEFVTVTRIEFSPGPEHITVHYMFTTGFGSRRVDLSSMK